MISNFFNSLATKVATLALITVSFLPASGFAYAGNNCCEQPCEDECFWSSCKGCLLGGALLGAAAGAATGYAAGHDKGHRGKRGRTGDTGPQGLQGPQGIQGVPGPAGTFAQDLEETLTFTPSITVTADGIGTTIIPFVSFPDGTVLEGAPIVVAALGVVVAPPFVINDPQFGEYAVGFQVDATTVAITATSINGTAVATRGPSTTIFTAPGVTLAIGAQGQTSANFVYGDDPVP